MRAPTAIDSHLQWFPITFSESRDRTFGLSKVDRLNIVPDHHPGAYGTIDILLLGL
jgi:hypothetical protein